MATLKEITEAIDKGEDIREMVKEWMIQMSKTTETSEK